MSKFDFEDFFGDLEPWFAVSKKYTRDEADEIFEHEKYESAHDFIVLDGYVYYGFGYYDGERYHGWWLGFGQPSKKNHVPVYIYERKKSYL